MTSPAGCKWVLDTGALGRRTTWPWLWVGLSLGCSANDVPFEVSRSSDAIEQGQVDDEADSVFRIVTRTGGFNALCSSTLIAPNLLLTARHCVARTEGTEVDCATDSFGATASLDELLFSNDTEPGLGSRWYRPARIVLHDDDSTFCGNDVALVVLEDVVPGTSATPSPPRLGSAMRVGESYSAIGYGGTDDAHDAEYGVRRSRSGLTVECLGRRCGLGVFEGEFVGLEGACRGDSGGPAIDDEGRVVGTLSRGAAGCTSPVYSSVHAFAELIAEAAIVAAEIGDTPLPVWAGGDPEGLVDAAVPPVQDASPRGRDADESARTPLASEGGCGVRVVPQRTSRVALCVGCVVAGLLVQRRRRSRLAQRDA